MNFKYQKMNFKYNNDFLIFQIPFLILENTSDFQYFLFIF